MTEAEKRIREALADPALFDEGASVDDTLRACERWHAANSPEAIRELLAEWDELKADAERLRAERDELRRQLAECSQMLARQAATIRDLESKLRSADAAERSINEALNSGDGSYRP